MIFDPLLSSSLTALRQKINGARWAVSDPAWLCLRKVEQNIAEEQFEELNDLLSRYRHPAFYVALTGGTIVQEKNQLALCMNISPSPDLSILRARVERSLRQAGITLPRLRFAPRIHLATLLKGIGADAVEWMQQYSISPVPSAQIVGVALIRSQHHDGIEYNGIMARYPLQSSIPS